MERLENIKFKDLKENGNYLNKYWQNEIWLPPLYFSNTIGNVPILNDDSKTVNVLRQGKSIYNDVLELNEAHIFSGEENGLQLKTQYEQTFKCLFELSKFPFDTQYCTMNIKISHSCAITLNYCTYTNQVGVSPRALYCVVDTSYGLGRSLGDCRPALQKG